MRLAIWSAVKDAYAFVFLRPGQFFRAVWLSLLLFGIYEAAAPWLTALPPQSIGTYFLLLMLLCLVELAGSVVVAVMLFRVILAGEKSWFVGIRFGRRQLRFLGIGIVIALVTIVPMFLLSQILGPFTVVFLQSGAINFRTVFIAMTAVTWIVQLATWFVVGRMVLALPAAAIDQPDAFSWAGEPSAGANAWKLLLGWAVCWLPLNGLELLAQRFLPAHVAVGTRFSLAGGGSVTIKPQWLLGDTFSFVFALFEIGLALAFYAYAYRQLASGTPASENAA